MEIVEDEKVDLGDLFGEEEPAVAATNKSISKSSLYLQPVRRQKSDELIFSVRTPNFLKFQPSEFTKATFDPIEERKVFDTAIAVVRWRYARDPKGEVIKSADGQPKLESNARLVRWSDGTYQIVVGDQIFNTSVSDMENCFAFQRQPNLSPPESIEVDDSDDTKKDAKAKDNTCLECIGSVRHRMKIQNVSLDAEADLRKAIKVSDRFNKGGKTAIRDYETIHMNPEDEQQARIQTEESQLRQEKKKKGLRGDLDGHYTSSFGRRPAMTADYLDGDDDDENNIAQIKSQFKKKTVQSSRQFTRKSTPSKKNKDHDGRRGISLDEDEERSDEDEELDEDRDFLASDDDADDIINDYEEEEEEEDEPEETVKSSRSKKSHSDGGAHQIREEDDHDEDEEPEFEDSEDDDSEDEDEDDNVEDDDDEDEDEKEEPAIDTKRGKDKTGKATFKSTKFNNLDEKPKNSSMKRSKSVNAVEDVVPVARHSVSTSDPLTANDSDGDGEIQTAVVQTKKRRKTILDSDEED